MPSSTVYMLMCTHTAHSNITPTAGAALPLSERSVEVRLLSGRRAGGYFLGSLKGAPQRPQLQLGARSALSRPSRHALTAPPLCVLRWHRAAIVRLQSGANDNGSTTYLPGVAAVAICAIADLSGGSLATLAR